MTLVITGDGAHFETSWMASIIWVATAHYLLWQRFHGTFRSMSRSCKRSSKRCVRRFSERGRNCHCEKRQLTSKEDFPQRSLSRLKLCVWELPMYIYIYIYSYLLIRTFIVHKLLMHTYVHIHIWTLIINIFIYIHHITYLNIYIYSFRYLNILSYIYIYFYLQVLHHRIVIDKNSD